jgi:hypothetical protein
MNIFSKLIFGVLLIITVWLGYLAVRDNAMEPLLSAQIEQYLIAAETASTIAYDPEPQIKAEAIEKFVKINNGPMKVIADEKVSWAMDLFELCIEDPNNEKCKDRDLKTLAALLSKTMKASLAATVRVNLDGTN